mgnify:CR=1 FL=1
MYSFSYKQLNKITKTYLGVATQTSCQSYEWPIVLNFKTNLKEQIPYRLQD